MNNPVKSVKNQREILINNSINEAIMKIKIHLSTKQILFLVITFFFIVLIANNGSGKTIIVDDDGGADFIIIQDAVNASNAGDTIFVKSGIYYEKIFITKTISLIGDNAQSTIIRGHDSNTVIITIKADHTLIQGFTIANGNHGIFIKADHVATRNNHILNASMGVVFYFSQFGISDNNTYSDCKDNGIRISTSHNNTITNCNFTNNGYGINFHMEWNNDNLISLCMISQNHGSGISIKGNRNEVNNCTIFSHDGNWGVGISIKGDDNNFINTSLFGKSSVI